MAAAQDPSPQVPSSAFPSGWLRDYGARIQSTGAPSPRPALAMVARTSIATFLGIAAVALVTTRVHLGHTDDLFMIASFGAMALVVYVVPQAEFAQPRNVIGGNVVSATIGVTVHLLVPHLVILAAALAVSLAAAAMQLTRTLNAPAGSTALLAVIGTPDVHHLGYLFVLTPVMVGAVIIVLVGVAVNNTFRDPAHHYPVYWW